MAPSPVEWFVNPEHVLAAIEYACKKLYYSIDRPNMNSRRLSESLDDKVMGDIAAIAVTEYCRDILGLQAVAYDQIRQDGFQQHDPGWDVVIGPTAYRWGRHPADPVLPPDELVTLSVRSSRIPPGRTLQQSVQQFDFKIFAPIGSYIENDVTADVELQVYYDYPQTQLENLCTTQEAIARCIQDREQCRQIMQDLNILERFGQCYLTTWSTKDAIVEYVQQLPPDRRYWTSYHAGHRKRMWVAPLRRGRAIRELATLYP